MLIDEIDILDHLWLGIEFASWDDREDLLKFKDLVIGDILYVVDIHFLYYQQILLYL